MAEEALKTYLRVQDVSRPHHVVQVEKVTVQTLSGTITRIDFVAAPNCLVVDDPYCEKESPIDLKCSSETWEQSWLSKASIKILCDPVKESN